VQRLSLSFHDRRAVGDSAYRIHWDASNIRDLVEALFPLLAGVSMFGGILYVTVRINWQLALVAIAVAPVLIAIARVYARRLRAHWHAAETFESRGLSVVQETLGALRVVNAFGQEQREAARFAERAADGSGAAATRLHPGRPGAPGRADDRDRDRRRPVRRRQPGQLSVRSPWASCCW
jgi:ABC-type multidrug transport system fused ATPase/permease subunit